MDTSTTDNLSIGLTTEEERICDELTEKDAWWALSKLRQGHTVGSVSPAGRLLCQYVMLDGKIYPKRLVVDSPYDPESWALSKCIKRGLSWVLITPQNPKSANS